MGDGLNTPPRVTSHFDLNDTNEQEQIVIEWEDHKVFRLNCLNALWKEGPIVSESTVKST